MKKSLVVLVCMLFPCLLQAQAFLGVRDTKYLQGGFQFRNRVYLAVEQSLYSEKIMYQKTRLYAGYSFTWNDCTVEANLYGSSLWNGLYQDAGALIKGEYKVLKPWSIYGIVNPHYDSGLDYKTLYTIGTTINVHKDIALTASYSTIPEFRDSEKRVRAGLVFKVANLCVHPEISVPVKNKVKTMRVMCSMRYVFGE